MFIVIYDCYMQLLSKNTRKILSDILTFMTATYKFQTVGTQENHATIRLPSGRMCQEVPGLGRCPGPQLWQLDYRWTTGLSITYQVSRHLQHLLGSSWVHHRLPLGVTQTNGQHLLDNGTCIKRAWLSPITCSAPPCSTAEGALPNKDITTTAATKIYGQTSCATFVVMQPPWLRQTFWRPKTTCC